MRSVALRWPACELLRAMDHTGIAATTSPW